MNRTISIALVCGAMALGSSAAWGQKLSKKDLVGTWDYVSAESIAKDGTKLPLVEGADPKGRLIFDGRRFSMQIIAVYPKLASNDRLKTTPEESKAVARGALSYWGTYTFNEADGTLVYNIERSSFPNQNGGTFKRVVKTLTADDLVYINPSTLAGRVNTNVWKRAK
jgi:hypothetical protein